MMATKNIADKNTLEINVMNDIISIHFGNN